MRNPYHILGVPISATRKVIQAAFMERMAHPEVTQADCHWARNQLLDEHLRLLWATQMPDETTWLKRLEPVSTFYAQYDHLAKLQLHRNEETK